jgi:RNA polymerase sigma-70 factor, ECF subfamily
MVKKLHIDVTFPKVVRLYNQEGEKCMADPLEEIYQQYKHKIYNYLYRSTLNHHLAEELTQETFFKAFRSIKSFKEHASLNTWLFKIARNTFLDEVKKKRNQLEEQFDPQETPVIDQSDEYTSLNEKLLIRNILLQLPERDRTLILLRDQNQLNYLEISHILDLNEGQVKIGLFRARKKFKELYEKESEVEK